MECGVECAFADQEGGVGGLLDPLDDGVAVSGSPAEGFEDEEVQRTAHEADIEVVHCIATEGCAKRLASLPSRRKGKLEGRRALTAQGTDGQLITSQGTDGAGH